MVRWVEQVVVQSAGYSQRGVMKTAQLRISRHRQWLRHDILTKNGTGALEYGEWLIKTGDPAYRRRDFANSLLLKPNGLIFLDDEQRQTDSAS